MIFHNSIGLETAFGYRTFEIYEGDLRDPEMAADLLVVSAFAGDYSPVAGSVIGALRETWSLDLYRLPRSLDLTEPFGFWLSRPLDIGNFKRLLCIEIGGGPSSVPEALDNVFVALALMDAKDIRVESVALPMLAAGSMKIAPAEVMAALLPAAKKALERHSTLQRILFVDRNAERAHALSEEMNRLLDRTQIRLPKAKLVEDLKKDLIAWLDRRMAEAPSSGSGTLRDLRRLLSRDDVRSFELGGMARRFVEVVVNDLMGPPGYSEHLAQRIGRLREIGVASWIQSYMHTLRWLGNESAHESNRLGQKPPVVEEDDVVICLFCIHRLLDFWVIYGTKRPD